MGRGRVPGYLRVGVEVVVDGIDEMVVLEA
jgi:hypothetical protein